MTSVPENAIPSGFSILVASTLAVPPTIGALFSASSPLSDQYSVPLMVVSDCGLGPVALTTCARLDTGITWKVPVSTLDFDPPTSVTETSNVNVPGVPTAT